VIVTREPGGTPLGEALRALLLDSEVAIGAVAEAYLMTAARAEHVQTVILPGCARGAIVLCDRFADSTLAYQGGGRGLPIAELRALQRLAVGPAWPGLTILLQLPIEVGLMRRERANDGNRIDREHLDFHQRVADWYAAEARADPDRWAVVDATLAPDVVHTAILENVMWRLEADSAVRAGGGST
jgi:dTMP kinase